MRVHYHNFQPIFVIILILTTPFAVLLETRAKVFANTQDEKSVDIQMDELAKKLLIATSENDFNTIFQENKTYITKEFLVFLFSKGDKEYLRENDKEALSFYYIVEKLAQRVGDKLILAKISISIGSVLVQQSQIENAREFYKKSEKIIEEVEKEGNAESKLLLANLRIREGQLYRREQNLSMSLEKYQETVKILENINSIAKPEKSLLSKVFTSIGNIYFDQRDFDRALEYYGKSLTIKKEIGENYEIILKNIGTILLTQNKFAEALPFFEESFQNAERTNNKPIMALTKRCIGEVQQKQGKLEEALKSFNDSLRLTNPQNSRELSIINADIAIIFTIQGDYSKALSKFKDSEELAKKTGYTSLIANIYTYMGDILTYQGKFEQALEICQKGLDLCVSPVDDLTKATFLGVIGGIYYDQGNYGLAFHFYNESLRLREKLKDNLGKAKMYNSIGNVYNSEGKYEQALDNYKKALVIKEGIDDKLSIAVTLGNIGTVFRSLGKYEDAIDFYQKSKTIREILKDKAGITGMLLNIGDVYIKQNKLEEALAITKEAVNIGANIDYPSLLANGLNQEGVIYLNLSKLQEAKDRFEKAISIIESIRLEISEDEDRSSFLSKNLYPYHSMVALYTVQNDYMEALKYAEKAKARVLYEILKKGKIDIDQFLSEQEKQQQKLLKEELIRSNKEYFYKLQDVDIKDSNSKEENAILTRELTEKEKSLEKAQADYATFRRKFFIAHPELKVYDREYAPVLEETGLLLDNKTVICEFVNQDGGFYVFALVKKQLPKSKKNNKDAKSNFLPGVELNVVKLEIDQTKLKNSIEKLRQLVSVERKGGFSSYAQELYEQLLKPIESKIKGKKSLIIIPDGLLWNVPFQVLQSKPNRYLCEDFAVSYAPSLTSLNQMVNLVKARKPAKSELLAFVNPTLLTNNQSSVAKAPSFMGNGEETTRLMPLNLESLKSELQRLYQNDEVKILSNDEATEKKAKEESKNAQIIQFAGHSLINNFNPMYSKIVLSQTSNDGEDGFLEAHEIAQMNLQTNMAIMSICESGSGKLYNGEGIIGLSWAFFLAGCPTNILAQWKITDASVNDFMIEFHRELKNKKRNNFKLTTAGTLQKIALKMLKTTKYRHPFYWGSFIVMGNP